MAAAAGVAFLIVMGILAAVIGKPLINFVADGPGFRRWVKSRGAAGKLVFVLIVTVQVIIAFIPGEPVELAAGYAFGLAEGSVLSLMGITLGSAIIFAAVRFFGAGITGLFFRHEDIQKLSFLKNEKKLEAMLFIIFFIPGTPKDLLTYFAGLTPVKFSRWMLISTAARIPSVVTSAAAGSAAGDKNFVFAAAVFGVTAVISRIGLYFYNSFVEDKNS